MKAISRKQFLHTALSGLAATGLGCTSSTSKPSSISHPPPNVLFLFSDQQHWQAMGCMDPFFDTPHLDELARHSIVFENGFCTTPQCSASRSSILTGFYPSTTHVLGNMGALGGHPLAQLTIGKLLQDRGYYTAYFGKWHLGNHPLAKAGWDEGGNEGMKSNTTSDLETVQKGISFLQNRSWNEKPFALFLSFIDPHDIYAFRNHPYNRPAGSIPLPESWYKESFHNKPSPQKTFMLEDQGKAIWGKPQKLWEQYRDCYRTKVHIYDTYVGQLIRELKRRLLWDQTIVIHTSDHGDMDAHHKLIFKGPFMYEQMVRVPCIIRVPRAYGGTGYRHVNDIDVVNVDFVPTLLDLCCHESVDCEGISLRPLLTGKPGQKKRDFVIGQYYSKQKWVNPIRMIRTSRFKYNRYIHYGEELYDLRKDPHELNNCADDPGYARIKKDLSSLLNQWIESHHDPFYSQKPTSRKGITIG